MQASIQVKQDADVQYLLRIGDTALVLAQRLAEWTGHAPVLEEDIALANMGLDLLGRCRLTLLSGEGVQPASALAETAQEVNPDLTMQALQG